MVFDDNTQSYPLKVDLLTHVRDKPKDKRG